MSDKEKVTYPEEVYEKYRTIESQFTFRKMVFESLEKTQNQNTLILGCLKDIRDILIEITNA